MVLRCCCGERYLSIWSFKYAVAILKSDSTTKCTEVFYYIVYRFGIIQESENSYITDILNFLTKYTLYFNYL